MYMYVYCTVCTVQYGTLLSINHVHVYCLYCAVWNTIEYKSCTYIYVYCTVCIVQYGTLWMYMYVYCTVCTVQYVTLLSTNHVHVHVCVLYCLYCAVWDTIEYKYVYCTVCTVQYGTLLSTCMCTVLSVLCSMERYWVQILYMYVTIIIKIIFYHTL